MLKKVKVKDIHPNPFQARKEEDAESIASLAEEIKVVGLWAGAFRGRRKDGRVELCFGHRRLAAIRLLKWEEVEVDLHDLTDEQMALQGLIENLQRQGLNDVERGEGIAAYIKLLEKSGNSGRPEILAEISRLLGLKPSRLAELLRIANFGEEAKAEVRERRIGGTVAIDAERIGGEEYVKVAAEKGLSHSTLKEMGKNLRDIEDEEVREKVTEKVVKGEITDPEEVTATARREQGKKLKEKVESLPPDLLIVIEHWTAQVKGWSSQIDEVLPYLEYIDTNPDVADRWRMAVEQLIVRLEKFV